MNSITERRSFIQGAGLVVAAASTAAFAGTPSFAQSNPQKGRPCLIRQNRCHSIRNQSLAFPKRCS
ncbi:twin-arginine translocation signal domain-containing protein [Bradyrhizobium cenepequi]|uniref:twin-arginine translocation signal domain-containing protein n=1 Tax=Bradyrhizobium cenepequi TaxID=2821403 RepID=UPI001CE23DA8